MVATRINSAVATVAAIWAMSISSHPIASAFVSQPLRSSPSTALDAIKRGGGRRGPPPKKEFVPPMNGEIKYSEMRVTIATKDGKDEALGVMTLDEARIKCKELGGLDLILVNKNSEPPVCKIVDYSKYRYMQEKKRKEKARNSKATEVKEVKMSYKIGEHDYSVRLKAATKFISQGNRVRATVVFRGREVQHDKLGFALLDKLAGDMEDICNMEGKPRREGRSLSGILSPTAEVVKSINNAKRAKEKEKKNEKAESLAKKIEEDEEKKVSVAGANGAVASSAATDDLAGSIGGLLDGIDIDDDLDDDVDVDASLDELLGSDKVGDDLFS